MACECVGYGTERIVGVLIGISCARDAARSNAVHIRRNRNGIACERVEIHGGVRAKRANASLRERSIEFHESIQFHASGCERATPKGNRCVRRVAGKANRQIETIHVVRRARDHQQASEGIS